MMIDDANTLRSIAEAIMLGDPPLNSHITLEEIADRMDSRTRELVNATIGLCWSAGAFGDGREQSDVDRAIRAVEAVTGGKFDDLAREWRAEEEATAEKRWEDEMHEAVSRHDEWLATGNEPSYHQGHSADEMPF